MINRRAAGPVREPSASAGATDAPERNRLRPKSRRQRGKSPLPFDNSGCLPVYKGVFLNDFINIGVVDNAVRVVDGAAAIGLTAVRDVLVQCSDVREIFDKDVLHLVIDGLALRAVRRSNAFSELFVYARVGILRLVADQAGLPGRRRKATLESGKRI